MFDDSEVGKSFPQSKLKFMCYIDYGLVPYFKEEVVKAVIASPYCFFVIQ